MRRVRVAAAVLALLALLVFAGAGLWTAANPAAPGIKLAFFPPNWNGIQVFRAIILGGATPVAGTVIPGAWLVHLDPAQPEILPGAILTGAGPFVSLAAAACLTPTKP